jgi:hypothetical protein
MKELKNNNKDIIYHYMSIENFEKVLLYEYFLMTWPKNDPYDPKMEFEYDKSRYLEFIQHQYNQNIIDKYQFFLNYNYIDHHIDLEKNKQILNRYENFRIFCASISKDKMLLLSHYSDNHKGVIIGINLNNLLRINNSISRTPVKYTNIFKPPYHHPFLNSDEKKRFNIELLGTKFIDWKYEDEYRLIRILDNTKQKDLKKKEEGKFIYEQTFLMQEKLNIKITENEFKNKYDNFISEIEILKREVEIEALENHELEKIKIKDNDISIIDSITFGCESNFQKRNDIIKIIKGKLPNAKIEILEKNNTFLFKRNLVD